MSAVTIAAFEDAVAGFEEKFAKTRPTEPLRAWMEEIEAAQAPVRELLTAVEPAGELADLERFVRASARFRSAVEAAAVSVQAAWQNGLR